jgi:fatty-acid desaturase
MVCSAVNESAHIVQVATASMIQWFNADFHATGDSQQNQEYRPHRLGALRPFHRHAFGLSRRVPGRWSWTAVATACGLYFVRMFAITGVYHRYFSHRTYKTSRLTQFIFALLGASATQRGPLWWAANHREHHRNSDTSDDPHSPVQYGFFPLSCRLVHVPTLLCHPVCAHPGFRPLP